MQLIGSVLTLFQSPLKYHSSRILEYTSARFLHGIIFLHIFSVRLYLLFEFLFLNNVFYIYFR